MRNLNFKISESLYNTWKTTEIREENPLHVYMHMDLLDAETYQIDLSIGFNPLEFRVGPLNRKFYYIGCTGAVILFNIDQGIIKDFTKGRKFKVNYGKSEKYKRNTDLTFSPEIGIGSGKSNIKANLGSIEHSKGQELIYKTEFSGTEKILDHNDSQRHVKWHMDFPKVESLVRDFVIGKLHLRIKVKMPRDENLTGSLSATPNHLRWYGPDRSAVDSRQNIIMWILYFYSSRYIRNQDGVRANFREFR